MDTVTLKDVAQATGLMSARAMAGALGIDGLNGTISLITLLRRFLFGQRPFYVLGHNPNTIGDVEETLRAGANAIEPDINVYLMEKAKLCVSHGRGNPWAPTLEQYLRSLRDIALRYPNLSLVVFDCKPPTNTPDLGLVLLRSIRDYLTFDVPLNVIISVATFDGTRMFDAVKGMLGPREGLMVDEENDPVAVEAYFDGEGIVNRCYGNGSLIQSAALSPHLRPSIERACGMRAAQNAFRFIYEYTTNDRERMREFIRTGVDGIITDDIAELMNVTREPAVEQLIRFAHRGDNPFMQPNAGYALEVVTGDMAGAGTDAQVTFTVTGADGTISKVVDTSLNGRMEKGDHNFVTIEASMDIGPLVSVTVQRDDSGNRPDWFLEGIAVRSHRFGVYGWALFRTWIRTTSSFTRPLQPSNE